MLSLSALAPSVAASDPLPILVHAVPVAPTSSREVTYVTGEVRARVQSDLSFRVSGRVVERLVEVGDEVKVGDLLARLDAEQQEAEINIANANLEAARAKLRLAELSFERQGNLLRTRVTTQAAVDKAQEDLATSREDVVSATAQLDTAKRELTFTDLRAEVDGVITARNAEVGQVARATQSIFTLARTGPRDGVFDVQEILYLKDTPEQIVGVSLISMPTLEKQGVVREVSPTIDGLTGTIKIKVDLGDARNWPLGSPIVGAFTSPPRPSIEVPWSAMSTVAGAPAVWVVDPGSNTVSLKRITIGKHSTKSVEIAKGVAAGDIIVVDGSKFLAPGSSVVVRSALEGRQ